MADRPGGEPTEPPSPKRLADARKKGEIARSKELVGAFVFLGAAIALVNTAPYALGQLGGHLRRTLARAGSLASDASASALVARAFDDAFLAGARALAPILIAAAACALLVGGLQAGGLFTFKPLA